MATTHFARTVFKGGQSGAAQRVQYITRTEPSRAEVQVRYQGLMPGTDVQREDLVYWRARNLPPWAGEDPVVFFRAAEQYGSAAWTAYEEWKFSLPRELSRPQQMAAARDMVQGLFGDKHPYVWAVHDPLAADGNRQPHVHVIWSARTLDGIERTPEQFFRRYNAAHPARGGAAKSRAFGHFGAVKAARVHYTDVMNWHLERAGALARLHPDRLEARGIVREPERRLSPSDSQALTREGVITEKMQQVLEHRERYQAAKAFEQRQAHTYWTERRQVLGLETLTARSTAHGLTLIQEHWRARRHTAPAHDVAAQRRMHRRGLVTEARHRLSVPLVGNRASKIYHHPGDPNYGDVAPHKQVVFWSRAEAEQDGYRAAANQHYGRGAATRREAVGQRLAHHPSVAPHDPVLTRDHARSKRRALGLRPFLGQDVTDLAHGGVQVGRERGLEIER